MNEAALDRLIAAQDAHVAALDAGDVGAIETTTVALRAAVGAASGSNNRAKLTEGLRTAEAAKARVNYLADRNQRQFDRLAGLAGVPRAHAYGRGGRLG